MKLMWAFVVAAGATMSLGAANSSMTMAAAGQPLRVAPVAAAPCVDSQGATTGFFCAPLSTRGTPVRACATRTRDVVACQASSARSYCNSRAFRTVQSYKVDRAGNLSELVCSSPAYAAAPITPAAPVAEWQPIFSANISGYDRREFGLRRGEDWRRCRAACDADSGCHGWTLSNNNNTCYLKWDGNPELVKYDACCTTGLKGMESGGPASVRARLRGGGR